MTEPLPPNPNPSALPQQNAAFWVHALHDLAQPVQALALFTERLRRMEVGPQAAPVVEHVGAGVQELQRVLHSLVQIAQRDAAHLAAQQQVQSQPRSEGQLPDLLTQPGPYGADQPPRG